MTNFVMIFYEHTVVLHTATMGLKKAKLQVQTSPIVPTSQEDSFGVRVRAIKYKMHDYYMDWFFNFGSFCSSELVAPHNFSVSNSLDAKMGVHMFIFCNKQYMCEFCHSTFSGKAHHTSPLSGVPKKL